MTIPSERAPRVVVTGAAGFSGWHTQVLLRVLVGFEVVPIRRDDFAGENLVYCEHDRRNLLTQGLHPRRIRAARERGGGLCGHVIVDLAIGHWALRQRRLLTPHLWRDTHVNLNDNALSSTATAQREEEGRGPFLRRQLGSGRGPQTGSSTPRRPREFRGFGSMSTGTGGAVPIGRATRSMTPVGIGHQRWPYTLWTNKRHNALDGLGRIHLRNGMQSNDR